MNAVSRHLPSGSVTFLFTDIEGSTKLLQQLGDEAYAEALLKHRRVLREALARHGGVEVDTQGDAFFVAFPTAPDALTAAMEAQSALAAGPIRVRMGLHTGTPHVAEEGYVGEDVHKGARLAAAGHGGQVLLSMETRQLVQTEVTELGEHRLKDFDEPVEVFQLGKERFPPLKTISNTNLPRPASSFVGRERELSTVVSLLGDGGRLVTLTGPGGSGKTRLAIEAAAELVPEFKAGVFWVSLAPLKDPALVVEAISQTLGAKGTLAEHVGERELLVLLDNFEQVVEAAPELSSLLEGCPNLKLLVTSRELLRVRGEVEYAVLPLADPEAVDLFYARSRVEPDEMVKQLCRALDNLPLAIELAAARASVLSPKQLVERLSDRLDLLKGGRDAEARQQTLRATIEWSYDLLDIVERRLFARLSVFVGGCTLEAAQQVAEADLDTLQSLVDKSLLRHSGERFWMLETIRDYAARRLEQASETSKVRRRQAEYFLTLAEEAEPHLREEAKGWPDRLEPDHDNLRAALECLEAFGETQFALRLAGGVWRFWYAKGYLAEGERRLEDLLRADGRATAARAKALIGASMIATNSGDAIRARSRAEEAIALCRQLGDPRGAADAQLALGFIFASKGELEEAERTFDESARAFVDLDDQHAVLVATRMLVWACHELGDLDRARALAEENLHRARAIGDEVAEAMTLGALAMVAADDGLFDDALAMLKESTRIFRDLGDVIGVALDLCRLARVLARMGRAEAAAVLQSSSVALREDIGFSVPWFDQMQQQTLATIRSQLDDETVTEAWERGRVFGAEDAATYVLEALD